MRPQKTRFSNLERVRGPFNNPVGVHEKLKLTNEVETAVEGLLSSFVGSCQKIDDFEMF